MWLIRLKGVSGKYISENVLYKLWMDYIVLVKFSEIQSEHVDLDHKHPDLESSYESYLKPLKQSFH